MMASRFQSIKKVWASARPQYQRSQQTGGEILTRKTDGGNNLFDVVIIGLISYRYHFENNIYAPIIFYLN